MDKILRICEKEFILVPTKEEEILIKREKKAFENNNSENEDVITGLLF